MKQLTLILLVSAHFFITPAQWRQTAGPLGGYYSLYSGDASVQIMVSSGNNIFTVSSSGNKKSGKLSFSPSNIFKAGNFHIIQGGYLFAVSSDNGNTWNEYRAPFYSTRKPAIKDDSLFQFATDTLFVSSNGAQSWVKTIKADSALYTDTNGVSKKIRIFNLERPVVTQSHIFALAASSQTGQFSTVVQSSDRGRTWTVTIPVNSVASTSAIASLGNDVFVSTNSGVITSGGNGIWQSANNGLPSASQQVVSEFIFSKGHLFALYSGTSGSIYKLINNVWQAVSTGGFNYYEVETGDGILFRNNSNGENFYLKPGNTWKEAGNDFIASTAAPMPYSSAELFTLHRNALYYSPDKGTNWYKSKDSVKTVSVQSDKLFLLKGTDLFISRNGATSWQLVNASIPAGDKDKITCFARLGNDIYLGVSGIRARTHLSPVWEQGGVYRSTDDGQSWEKIVSGLPQEAGVPAPVSSIVSSDGLVYANTLGGTFRYTNGTWVVFGNFLPSGESLFEIRKWKSKRVAVASKGVYFSDSTMSVWNKYVGGLTGNFGYFYQFKLFIYKDTLYTFSLATGDTIFRLQDTMWVPAQLRGPEGKQLYALNSIDGVLYAGTVEDGIWRLDPASPTEVESAPRRMDDVLISGVYPNPVSQKLNQNITSAGKAEIFLSLYNQLGELISSRSCESTGSTVVSLPTGTTAPGIYILKTEVHSGGAVKYTYNKVSILR